METPKDGEELSLLMKNYPHLFWNTDSKSREKMWLPGESVQKSA